MELDGEMENPAGQRRGLKELFLKILDRILHSRYSDLYLAIILLIIATLPRLFYISRSIKPNGIDEGVQIMAGRMMNLGYEFYTQINTVQAPLMLSVYGLIEADPVVFRIFSTVASLIIMGCVMLVGKRVGGRHVMVAAGAFAAMDLMFLHESRLASLDMFCLLWISLAVAFFIKYRQSGKKWAVLLTGVSLAIGSMIKLFAVIAAGTMGIIMLLDWVNDTDMGPLRKSRTESFLPARKFGHVRFRHMVLLVLAYSLVVLTIMLRFGLSNTLEGMFLNQLDRPHFALTVKLQFLGVFALLNGFAIPFFFFGFKPLYRKGEGVILIITMVFFIYFMVQAATWIHHFVFLSPGLALTAGVGVIRVGHMIDRRRRRGKRSDVAPSAGRTIIYMQVILMILVAIMGGGFSLLVKERGESAQYKAASLLEEMTEREDYVISGDPLIPVIAERSQPPEVVNLAELKYPQITSDEMNRTTIIYGVEVVIITYHLEDMKGYVDFVSGNYRLKARYTDNSLPLMESDEFYSVYYLPENSDLRDHELWGLEKHPPINE